MAGKMTVGGSKNSGPERMADVQDDKAAPPQVASGSLTVGGSKNEVGSEMVSELQGAKIKPPQEASVRSEVKIADTGNPCGIAHNMKLNVSGFSYRSGHRKRQLQNCFETGMSCYFGYVSRLSGEIGPESVITNIIGPRVDTVGILTCTRWNLHRCQRHYVHHKVQECIRTHNCSLCHALGLSLIHI